MMALIDKMFPDPKAGLMSPRMREVLNDPIKYELLLNAYFERKRREERRCREALRRRTEPEQREGKAEVSEVQAMLEAE